MRLRVFANARYGDVRFAFLHRSCWPRGRRRLAVSMCVRGEMKYVCDVKGSINYVHDVKGGNESCIVRCAETQYLQPLWLRQKV